MIDMLRSLYAYMIDMPRWYKCTCNLIPDHEPN